MGDEDQAARTRSAIGGDESQPRFTAAIGGADVGHDWQGVGGNDAGQEIKPRPPGGFRRLFQWAQKFRLDGFISVGLLLFTGIQAWVAYRQWSITEGQLDAMVRQLSLMELDQRPWIIFDEPRMDPFKPNEPIRCSVFIENRGRTSATIDDGFFGIEILPGGQEPAIPREMEFGSGRKASGQPGTLAPGSKTRIYQPNTPTMSEEMIREVMSGKFVVFAFARVDYTDGTGRPHKTRMYLKFNPESDRFTGQSEYNDAD